MKSKTCRCGSLAFRLLNQLISDRLSNIYMQLSRIVAVFRMNLVSRWASRKTLSIRGYAIQPCEWFAGVRAPRVGNAAVRV